MFSEGRFLRDVFGRGVFWGTFSGTFSFSGAFSEVFSEGRFLGQGLKVFLLGSNWRFWQVREISCNTKF
jgi:hypothetical protein